MERRSIGLLLVADSRDRDQAADTVREAAVDGFIVYSAPRNDPRVEAALARRVPMVTVDQPRDAPTPFVGIDDRAAAANAAEHLHRLGHRRVGVLSFVTALDADGRMQLDICVERLVGYEDGLGNAWDDGLVRTCRPNALEPARRATLELLGSDEPPSAILAMSDVLAIGALQAAAEVGLDVPEQLSVVGFDDSLAARLSTPPLTTVSQPHEEKGRVAAETLLRAIDQGTVSRTRRRTILPTELVIRGTTAPPKTRR